MAFIMSAALGGAAKRASEIFEEERKEAISLIDSSLKDFSRLGVAKLSERKKKRKELDEAGQILKNAGFSDAQIAVAWQQNRHQQVVDHVIRQQALSKDNPEIAAIKPADIITLAEGQDLGGMTYDQLLDGVMGKVSSGMTTADAIADIGGTGLQGAYMKQRADAAAAATGMNLAELRALATEDFEYGSPIQGAISLVDPVESARASAVLSGDEAGMFSGPAADSNLRNYGNQITGAKGVPSAGVMLYEHEKADRNIMVSTKVAELIAKKQAEVNRNRLSGTEILELKAELVLWAKDKGIYAGAPDQKEEDTSSTSDIPILQGTDDQTLFTETLDMLPTLEGDKKDAFIDAAYNKVYEYYKGKEATNQRAREKANAWLERVMTETNKTSQVTTNAEDVPEGMGALVGAGQ